MHLIWWMDGLWWCFSCPAGLLFSGWTDYKKTSALVSQYPEKNKKKLISKLEIPDCNRYCRTTFPAPNAAPAGEGEVVLWFHCLDEIFTISCKEIISAERAWGSPSSLGTSQAPLGWKTSTGGCVCVNWGAAPHLLPRAVMCGTRNWFDVLSSAPVPSAALLY